MFMIIAFGLIVAGATLAILHIEGVKPVVMAFYAIRNGRGRLRLAKQALLAHKYLRAIGTRPDDYDGKPIPFGDGYCVEFSYAHWFLLGDNIILKIYGEKIGNIKLARQIYLEEHKYFKPVESIHADTPENLTILLDQFENLVALAMLHFYEKKQLELEQQQQINNHLQLASKRLSVKKYSTYEIDDDGMVTGKVRQIKG
jgi:hypothetical protein